jgi:hypothetical protein
VTFAVSLVLAASLLSNDREVVVATVPTADAAREEMIRAKLALDYPLAFDTLQLLPARRTILGSAITAHREGTEIVVSVFLGNALGAGLALEEAQSFFLGATIVERPRLSDDEALDGEATALSFEVADLVIVASSRSYAKALKAARAYEKTSGLRYSSRGLVFDHDHGLIFPDDDEDAFRGRYLPRQGDTDCGHGREGCVSVERSEGYPGLKPGFYIVVAGIGMGPWMQDRLNDARKSVKRPYAYRTVIWTGCAH